MSAPAYTRLTVRALAAAAAAAAFVLATTAAVQAEAPIVGGSVPGVLSLSMSQPSGFSSVARAGARRHVKRGEHLYGATIELEVTATEMPTRLSIADGEVSDGRRLGRLVGGGAVLSRALQAAAGHGAYRSLDRKVDPQLAQWSQPLANQTATIRLRQAYRGGAAGLRLYHKLLLVTVTAGGP
jgi:hypothetical protein